QKEQRLVMRQIAREGYVELGRSDGAAYIPLWAALTGSPYVFHETLFFQPFRCIPLPLHPFLNHFFFVFFFSSSLFSSLFSCSSSFRLSRPEQAGGGRASGLGGRLAPRVRNLVQGGCARLLRPGGCLARGAARGASRGARAAAHAALGLAAAAA